MKIMPRSEYNEFIDDWKVAIVSFLEAANDNGEFKSIYKKGTATSKVLRVWAQDNQNNQELLNAAAGAAKRAIALVCIRQYSLLHVELRRFIECIAWYIYFADHSVEWNVFKGNPGRNWVEKKEKPIETAANASMNFYLRYLRERMLEEPSGLARSAVDTFRDEYGKLSLHIHGGTPAINGSLALTYDREDKTQHREMRNRCYKVFKSGCIIVAALKVELLENLSATDRKYFDNLVSASTARKIREQPFGL